MTDKPHGTYPAELTQIIGDVHWEAVTEGKSRANVFRLAAGDHIRYLKIGRDESKSQVSAEYERLRWLAGRIAVPEVLYYTEDAQAAYLLSSEIRGLHPLHDELKWSPQERIDALAQAARLFHALPVAECPFSNRRHEQIAAARDNIERELVQIDQFEPEWQSTTPQALFKRLLESEPEDEDQVVTHGDMYPVNLRFDPHTHEFLGCFDVGAVGISDRYTDLALVARAIGWHLDSVWITRFFEAYGITRIDTKKLAFYQLLDEFF